MFWLEFLFEKKIKQFLNRILIHKKLQKLIKMEDKVKTLTDMGFPLDRV